MAGKRGSRTKKRRHSDAERGSNPLLVWIAAWEAEGHTTNPLTLRCQQHSGLYTCNFVPVRLTLVFLYTSNCSYLL